MMIWNFLHMQICFSKQSIEQYEYEDIEKLMASQMIHHLQFERLTFECPETKCAHESMIIITSSWCNLNSGTKDTYKKIATGQVRRMGGGQDSRCASMITGALPSPFPIRSGSCFSCVCACYHVSNAD